MQDFRALCFKKSITQPCQLCGEIHSLQILSYPERYWRDPESGKNIKCKIIAVICEKSRNLGKQYTIRILPDFLLPYKVIRSDNVLHALSEDVGPTDLEKTCSILGCIDIRTARKYLHLGYTAIKKASVSLAEKLSQFTVKQSSFNLTPDTHFLASFRFLVDRYNQMQIHIHGSAGYVLQSRIFQYLGFHWPQKKSMTYGSDPAISHDTS